MPMRVREIVDEMFRGKAKDNPMLAKIIKAKLILHGIHPDRITDNANEDPLLIAKVEKLSKELLAC